MRKTVLTVLLAAMLLPLGGAQAHAALVQQDDAGSGRDAPNVPTPTFRIEPGRVVTGTLDGYVLDSADWYAFDAPAGATLQAATSAAWGCVALADAAGAELGYSCGAGYESPGRVETIATTAGTYYVRYNALTPGDYRLSVGVGAPAPMTEPVGVVRATLPPERGPAAFPSLAPATAAGPHTVIAVVDSGVNLYHDFFDAPALTAHPSGWLPGFPASATTVGLSLGEPDYASAVAADGAAIAGLARSSYDRTARTYDEHLYTFPGTRVVAGISFGEYYIDGATTPGRPVLDDHGRGTYLAGLAAGAGLGTAEGDVLIVAVEVVDTAFEDGVRWAARQPWIDAIAVGHSLVGNPPMTTDATGSREGMEWATYEAYQAGKPVFMPAGFASSLQVPTDKCSTYTSDYSGPSWVTRIGNVPGQGGTWHCLPVDAVARNDVLSTVKDSLDATGGAVSIEDYTAAAPNAAGQYGHLLLAARRAGSAVTRMSARDHFLRAATPVPSPAPLAEQGYGVLGDATVTAAASDIAAGAGPRPRPETTEWFARDRAVRDALWGPTGAMAGPDLSVVFPHDDASSGGDAPEVRSADVPVMPGWKYGGMLAGGMDTRDWYAFEATGGDVLRFTHSAPAGCVTLVDASGAQAARACPGGLSSSLTHPLPSSGTWYLRFEYAAPLRYAFAFTLDGSAPPPVLL